MPAKKKPTRKNSKAKKPKKAKAKKSTASKQTSPAKDEMENTPAEDPAEATEVSQPSLNDAAVGTVEIEQEVQRSYIDYAMSVIVGRALPDVRDGLKPVHRRILWGMLQLGVRPGVAHKKSAKIVGEVMGNYHPHGDSAIYDALARMAQDFAMRGPLVDGKGNFGTVDGDPPGAPRYTEARLSKLAMEMLADIDEETVDFQPNYSNDPDYPEPVVLPSRLPNLLVNGSTGIAVGMATNIPPHNLGEVIEGVVAVLDDPDTSPADLRKIIKGPDFPMGGEILGQAGINDAYKTGRGTVKVRARCTVEETKRASRIVVTELPYMVSGDRVIEKIADLVNKKKVTGISDARNESNRQGTRIVIELKRDAIPQVVLNNLYKHTQLQDSFGMIMLALVGGVPKTLKLDEILRHYIDHQVDVVTRRTKYRLRKAEERLHIVEGLLKAIDHIDAVIKLIRAAKSAEEAHGKLMKRYKLSEVQAEAILNMMLRRLAALERQKLKDDEKELKATISELQGILKSPKRLKGVIKEEMLAIKESFATPRRTKIVPEEGEFNLEDLIPDDEVIVSVTRSGYIKRVRASSYRTQGRGGRGVRGAQTKEDDIVQHLLTTTNHAHILFFSNRGKVYRIKAHEIPEKERTARGVSVRNILPFVPNEQIAALIDTRDFKTHRYLVIATRKGIIKKTEFTAYDTSRRDGIIALNLREGDEVVKVRATEGSDELIMVSRRGLSITFKESDVRPMGRTAGGVIGMRLGDDDAVVSFDVVDPNGELLCVTEGGFGKRTSLDRYSRQRRGGKGIRTFKIAGTRGPVVGAGVVREGNEVFLIASDGQVIKIRAGEISRQGRNTTGVRVMRMSKGTTLVAMAPVIVAEEEAT